MKKKVVNTNKKKSFLEKYDLDLNWGIKGLQISLICLLVLIVFFVVYLVITTKSLEYINQVILKAPEGKDYFVRSGNDIFCRVPITFVQAALGGTIEVNTLEEKEKIKIPKGTQNGKTLRLKGKGIPHIRGYGRGDQIVEVSVLIPTNLSNKQEELLREFERLSGGAN